MRRYNRSISLEQRLRNIRHWRKRAEFWGSVGNERREAWMRRCLEDELYALQDVDPLARLVVLRAAETGDV